MPGPEKRIPGQSNADYDRARSDPNADFLMNQSLHGSGDPTWVMRLAKALSDWWERLKR